MRWFCNLMAPHGAARRGGGSWNLRVSLKPLTSYMQLPLLEYSLLCLPRKLLTAPPPHTHLQPQSAFRATSNTHSDQQTSTVLFSEQEDLFLLILRVLQTSLCLEKTAETQ